NAITSAHAIANTSRGYPVSRASRPHDSRHPQRRDHRPRDARLDDVGDDSDPDADQNEPADQFTVALDARSEAASELEPDERKPDADGGDRDHAEDDGHVVGAEREPDDEVVDAER